MRSVFFLLFVFGYFILWVVASFGLRLTQNYLVEFRGALLCCAALCCDNGVVVERVYLRALMG